MMLELSRLTGLHFGQGLRKPLTDSMLASTAPPGLLKAPLRRTPAAPREPVFGIDV